MQAVGNQHGRGYASSTGIRASAADCVIVESCPPEVSSRDPETLSLRTRSSFHEERRLRALDERFLQRPRHFRDSFTGCVNVLSG